MFGSGRHLAFAALETALRSGLTNLCKPLKLRDMGNALKDIVHLATSCMALDKAKRPHADSVNRKLKAISSKIYFVNG